MAAGSTALFTMISYCITRRARVAARTAELAVAKEQAESADHLKSAVQQINLRMTRAIKHPERKMFRLPLIVGIDERDPLAPFVQTLLQVGFWDVQLASKYEMVKYFVWDVACPRVYHGYNFQFRGTL